MSFRAASIKCVACGKTVYAMEAMNADGKVFHKGCMKCAECNGVLKLGNYAAVGGKYYCKPHFKQLFKLKGNYSSGFGEEGESKSHSFSVPTGRADFNRAPGGSGARSPSTPIKSSGGGSTPSSPAPAPKEPATTTTTTTTPTLSPPSLSTSAPKEAAPASAPTPAVPQLASPSPVHRTVTTPSPPSLGSSGGGASPARGLGASGGGFESEKNKLEAERKAFEDERRRFEEEKKKKDADHKAAVAAAEKELAAAKESAAAAASKPAEPTPAPAPVTLSASEQLICDAFSLLLADSAKKDLALKKVGLAK